MLTGLVLVALSATTGPRFGVVVLLVAIVLGAIWPDRAAAPFAIGMSALAGVLGSYVPRALGRVERS